MDKIQRLKSWALSKVGCGYLWGATGYTLTRTKLNQVIASQGEDSQAAKYGAKWLGKQCYDCAQLVRWGLRAADVQGVDISGASSQWKRGAWVRRDVIATLPREQVCVLYREDRNSNPMGHTGIYLGDGTVVHARSTRYGVVHQEFAESSWTHWALPDFDGEGAAHEVRDTLYPGAQGGQVVQMQGLLMAAGYSLEQFGADGKFGSETKAALRAFQGDNELEPDGICGPLTWDKLDREAVQEPQEERHTYLVTIRGLDRATAQRLCDEYKGDMEEMEE